MSAIPSSPALHPQTENREAIDERISISSHVNNQNDATLPVRNKRHVVVAAAVGGDVGGVAAGDDEESRDRASWTKRPPHLRVRRPSMKSRIRPPM